VVKTCGFVVFEEAGVESFSGVAPAKKDDPVCPPPSSTDQLDDPLLKAHVSHAGVRERVSDGILRSKGCGSVHRRLAAKSHNVDSLNVALR